MKSKERGTMQKILLTIMCAALFNIGNPKPALSGFILDPAAIAQNFGGTAQTIYDTAVQDIFQNGMLKQLQTQGFNLASLKTLLTSQLGKYLSNLIKESATKQQVKSTKAKETELLEQERDLYIEAAKANINEKLKIAEKDKSETEKLLANKKKELNKKEQQLRKAESNRQKHQGKGDEKEIKAIDELEKAQNEYNTVINDVDELEKLLKEKKEKVKLVQQEKSIIGTEKDPKVQNMSKRAEIIKNEKEDTGILIKVEINEDKDWASLKDLDDFSIDGKTYKDVINAYHYEPDSKAYTDLHQGKELQTKQQELEAIKDKILRNRKYLVINTAVHLLQVSTTARREIPIREPLVKEWFDKTKEKPSEIEAITAYSNTRIENSRALLLYARLLSAKMQYNAAREIYRFDLEKLGKIEDNDYSTIDLGKYILTMEEIKEAIKNSSMNKVVQGVLGAAIGK